MDNRIVMMLVLLTLLLLGIGILIYVYLKSLQRMTKQYQETGMYPKKYFTLVGSFYTGSDYRVHYGSCKKEKQVIVEEVSVKKKSVIPLLIGLFMLITFILMMMNLTK